MCDGTLYNPNISDDSEWQPNESDLYDVDSESDFDDSDHTITESQFPQLSTRPLQKAKSKSKVWLSFGHLARHGRVISKCAKRYFCKLCLENKVLKRYIVYNNFELNFMKLFRYFFCTFISYSSGTSGTVLTAHLLEHDVDLKTAVKDKNQRKLTEVFFGPPAKRHKVNNNNETQHTLNRQFALWICCDLLPFGIVEKRGFRDFWNATKGDALELPSRTTVAVGALDDTYICFKNRLIQVLSQAPRFGSMTLDFWTDNHKRISYVTYTYHYMDEWTIKTFVLKTSAFAQSKSSDNIKQHFENTLEEFGLCGKKITVVSDGELSLVKACRLLKVMRTHCISHRIHLLITKDLFKHPTLKDFFEKFLSKLRSIHFKLIFKYQELKLYDNEEKQKKFHDAVHEAADLGTINIIWLMVNFFIVYIGKLAHVIFFVVQKKFWKQRIDSCSLMKGMISEAMDPISLV